MISRQIFRAYSVISVVLADLVTLCDASRLVEHIVSREMIYQGQRRTWPCHCLKRRPVVFFIPPLAFLRPKHFTVAD